MNKVSHPSFTPATDFEDAASIWNGVSSSWWDFTRDDSSGDINIKARGFGWFSSTLARTTTIQTSTGTMTYAQVVFNSDVDFRDVNVSSGWFSYDFETVAIHEIGHVAGIAQHSSTVGSVMRGYTPPNFVDRTLNSHDVWIIGWMY